MGDLPGICGYIAYQWMLVKQFRDHWKLLPQEPFCGRPTTTKENPTKLFDNSSERAVAWIGRWNLYTYVQTYILVRRKEIPDPTDRDRQRQRSEKWSIHVLLDISVRWNILYTYENACGTWKLAWQHCECIIIMLLDDRLVHSARRWTTTRLAQVTRAITFNCQSQSTPRTVSLQ